MDVDERRRVIASAPSAGSDARLWVLGEWKNVPIVKVPVTALVLNIDNRRFSAERRLFEEQLGHEFDPENNDIDAHSVESILLDRNLQVDGDRVVGTPGKDYLALRQDWQRRQQESPFWIRPDGTVRNGNRRLAMLRRLRKEEGAGGHEWVDAVVFNHDTVNEVAMFEMEQREQLTEDYKVRYTDINLLLAIKDAADDLEIDWYSETSIVEVAGELQHVMRDNQNYAIVQLYAIKFMDEYLNDLDLAGRYDKLIGQIERFREVGRAMRRVEADDSGRSPAMLNVMFAAVNAGKTHLEIREIRKLYTKDFEAFDRLAAAIADAEGDWEQPSEEDPLGDPEVVDDEPDDLDATDEQPDPPGPVVTNYPKDEVKTIIDDAVDSHQASQNEDLLKTVKEVNHRLAALSASPNLHAELEESIALRDALDTALQWFDDNHASLR